MTDDYVRGSVPAMLFVSFDECESLEIGKSSLGGSLFAVSMSCLVGFVWVRVVLYITISSMNPVFGVVL